jgi:hypothetical protein
LWQGKGEHLRQGDAREVTLARAHWFVFVFRGRHCHRVFVVH